ncbi:uncharacterized protein [Ambystoma mexicanum]|uniref:uncharacterized protein n=1 Tax=Ambystoma mexicanum TaxID=8296 RepID=UPI0037E7B899
MVSKESNHSLAQRKNINQDKAMTVRSVLLNRDSPDIESRLKRRRNRTQQVRFKDQVDGAEEDQERIHRDGPAPKSALYIQRDSSPQQDANQTVIQPLVNSSSMGRGPPQPSRRHWYQSRPCSLTLPNPKKASMSTAIQTSPSLQKHFPAFRFRSKSVSDFGEEQLLVALANHREQRGLARQNDLQVSGYNGEIATAITLNGGTQMSTAGLLENRNQPASPHVLQAGDRRARRKPVQNHLQQTHVGSRFPQRATSSTADNGLSQKQSCPSALTSNSPQFHPFYPTHVASEDYGRTNLVTSMNDSSSSPQHGGERVSPTKRTPQGSECDELSSCESDPKVDGSPGIKTKDAYPSLCTHHSEQSTLPMATGKMPNCAPPLASIPAPQDSPHLKNNSSPQGTPQISPRRISVLSSQDHRPVILNPTTRCPSFQGGCRTLPNTPIHVLPPDRSPCLLIEAATFQQESIETPGIIHANFKDMEQLGQMEGGTESLSSRSDQPSPSKFEPDFTVLKEQEHSSGPIPPPQADISASCFSPYPQSQTEDPLEEYYTVRTREPTPSPMEAEKDPAEPTNSWTNPPGEGCLTADQSETLRHVKDLLELVAASKSQAHLSKGDEELLPQGHLERVGCLRVEKEANPHRGGLYQKGDVSARLQALEGVLETSQQTIKVLLDVIQDLERKEARRDGRRSYRTGQDIENCGTCRDCACIIYSVEHDFRQQEGRFLRVLRLLDDDATESSPHSSTPSQPEPSPAPKQPSKLEPKRSKRKCFWFL